MQQRFKALVLGIVDFAGNHPWKVLVTAILILVGSLYVTSHLLQVRTDFMDLLPRDAPGLIAYEHQLARLGGTSQLVVVAESNNRDANARYIDAIGDVVDKWVAEDKACADKCGKDHECRNRCPNRHIKYTERGTKEIKGFIAQNKALYASKQDLQDLDDRLDDEIADRVNVRIVNDDAPKSAAPSASASQSIGGLDKVKKIVNDRVAEFDKFPNGYYCTPDGKDYVLKIVADTTGMGDAEGDRLYFAVNQLVKSIDTKSFDPQMKVGITGDIAGAVAEKQSLVSQALWAVVVATGLILIGLALFYRSIVSLAVIFFPAFFGVAVAYLFATLRFGYVNTTGAFLGAIILGNGINYPIVLLSRYHEFRSFGLPPAKARREAVWNAFRAELVGATVAAIAYGSLTITAFRGFSQFGTIGFVGMFVVWLSMIPLVPAMIALIERYWPNASYVKFRQDGARNIAVSWLARVTEKQRWFFVIGAIALTVVAASKLPSFLRDPWEYDFSKLSSKSSETKGAAMWSTKADHAFGGRSNIAGAIVLADYPEQTRAVRDQILENSRNDTDPKLVSQANPRGELVAGVTTIWDSLPGEPDEQAQKIEIIERIRARFTKGILARLTDQERADIDDLLPKQKLTVVTKDDLPAWIRRRFSDKAGVVGAVMYVRTNDGVSMSDGKTELRLSRITDNVKLHDGTVVQTASRSTIFAEMIKSMQHDGPLATAASFLGVVIVVLLATHTRVGAFAVLLSLMMGVTWMMGLASATHMKLHFLNFIALPITFGIGCEYPFNVFDRSRLLRGDVSGALRRVGGAVALCSYTTIIGYGSLLLADLRALANFGWLAVVGEFVCLSGALLFLPSLLHLVMRKEPEKKLASEENPRA